MKWNVPMVSVIGAPKLVHVSNTLCIAGMKIYVLLVYLDVRDEKRNKYIYENLDLMISDLDNKMSVIVMGDFKGHGGFLGDQDNNHNLVKLLEFVERWNLIIMNCDTKCRGTFTRIYRDNKSVIDYILVNEAMYKHYDSMVIDEDKLLYDLSDHVYIYVDVIIPNGKPKFKNRKV